MKKTNSRSRAKPARDALAIKPLSTAREITEILGISEWTVYQWAKSGRIPVIRLSRRIVRFDADAVLAALKEVRA
jgi:excisionase family DNA binding protein